MGVVSVGEIDSTDAEQANAGRILCGDRLSQKFTTVMTLS